LSLARNGHSQFAPLYPDAMPLFDKINTIVKRHLSRLRGDRRQERARPAASVGQGRLRQLPICMAKTQYFLLDRPEFARAPNDHVVPVAR